MTHKLKVWFPSCLLAFTLLAFSSNAHAEGDVWLRADSGKLTLGLVNEEGTEFTPGVRIYSTILTPVTLPFSPFDLSSGEPGFQSPPGSLPANQPVNLTVESLTVWDGAALVPVSGVDFTFDLSSGFESSSTGGLHDHAPFGLIDLTSGVSPVNDGVYVAAFRASMEGVEASEVGYLVMLHDTLITNEDYAEEVSALLETYESEGTPPVFSGKDFSYFAAVQDHVASSIPEPTGLVPAVVAAIAFASACRRRRLS